ncbi:MAG: FAD-binding oxidoreductase [Deltaproteobacteria bacterium]|nr:MAG: FAD-binding oxidoreductase [Deltaproteobacteria bacterium]
MTAAGDRHTVAEMLTTAAELDALGRDLVRMFGDDRVSRSEPDLAAYSRDMWPRLLLSVRDGRPLPHAPHFVVWPETEREVVAVVRLARERGVPIVPYGGGSGVCGGAVPVRGGITVDLKRMTAMSAIDRDEMLCDVEAGINGERFERALAARGYTFGHFPSSIYCSTVGGWLATRAAGQMSTKYGKVEDRVAGVTLVTGRGELVRTDELQRAITGPNWTQLVLGSEGTLGIITSARLRVSLAPELRLLRGFEFDDVAAGVEAIRRVMQRGLRPAVVRLYDEADTFFHSLSTRSDHSGDTDPRRFAPAPPPGAGALPDVGVRPPETDRGRRRGLGRALSALLAGNADGARKAVRRELVATALARPRLLNRLATAIVDRVSRKGCLLIIGLEGSRIRTEIEAGLTFAELARAGGRDLGEEPGRHWYEHRYSISYNMSKAFAHGVFVDTMEVAATWERLMDLYAAVRAAIANHAAVMAHFSHAYPEGCSIYFSFAGYGDTREEAERVYDAVWRDGLAAASRAGGTISHHHGVGLLKADAMAAEHRDAMTVLRAIKRTFDPDNIMNPGKLGLP